MADCRKAVEWWRSETLLLSTSRLHKRSIRDSDQGSQNCQKRGVSRVGTAEVVGREQCMGAWIYARRANQFFFAKDRSV